MRSIARALYIRSFSSSYSIVPAPRTSNLLLVPHRQLGFCTDSESERATLETGTESDSDGHDISLFLERLRGVRRDHSIVPLLRDWIDAGNTLGSYELKTVFGRLEWKKKFAQALEVVEWLLKEKPFELVEHHYARWLVYLGKVDGHEKVKRAFEVIPREFQTEVVYCRLFEVFLQHHRVSDAVGVMKRLMRQKMPVPVYMFNNLMSYFDKKSMDVKLRALLRIMEEQNISYSLQTYNILLSKCSRDADLEHMEQIWELLQADTSVKPDFVSYATLASAYFFAGQDEKALSATVKAEKALTVKSTTILRLKKLTALYGSLKQGADVSRVYGMLKAMPGALSVSSYVCVVEAYGEAGLVDCAEEVIKQMKLERGLHHRAQYNAIIGVYCKNGKMEKAKEVFKELSDKHEPDLITYSYLLLGYLKTKQSKEAVARLKDIITLAGNDNLNRNVFELRPWVLNMSSILELLAEEGRKKPALALLTALQKAKLNTFSRSYQLLRKTYERLFVGASVGLAGESVHA